MIRDQIRPPFHRTASRQVLGMWCLWALALLPPAYVALLVLTQTVDVPFADQWALVPLLAHMEQGKLTWAELWAQHNEHRLLFPRLIMLGLARLSGWNTHAEMLMNIALAGGIWGVLVWQARATARSTKTAYLALVPVLSLLVFSLGQAENWWGGWNIQIFLNVLAVVGSLVLLARPGPPWSAFAVALCCGVVATYSYSTGLLVWPVGALLLVVQPARRTPPGVARLALWIVAGSAASSAFFTDYTWTTQTTSPADALAHPLRYLTYALTYLGAPPSRGAVEYVFGVATGDTAAICNLGDSGLCADVNAAAIIAGVAGVLLFALLVWRLACAGAFAHALPALGLGVYALSTGTLTSLGRAGYGNHQALAQRYATTASLFWAALLLLLWLWAERHGSRSVARWAGQALVFGIAGLLLLCTLQGPDHFRWQRQYLAPARDALQTLDDDALLARLYFDPAVVRRDVAILRRYHLAVFR